MALTEPDRCIAHFVSGPNKGRRCRKNGIYIPGGFFGYLKGETVKVCLYHLRSRAWMRDVVQRFYAGRYDDGYRA